MITPKEIKETALRWWRDLLLETVMGQPCFPKDITRIGKVSSKDILNRLTDYKTSIETLRLHSKEHKKAGYRLVTGERYFEKIGKQTVPEKVTFDTLEDYLHVAGKEKEYQVFLKNLSLIGKQLPILIDWVKINPLRLIEHDTWHDTLKVCHYFLHTPRPNLYIRQLPIDVHTKYIMDNKGIMQSLLDFLIPDYINKEESKFELRYNLKYAEPLIRIRFLDTQLSPVDNTTDISLTLSEFSNFSCSCEKILVAENIMNFLTLPHLSKTIAVWSGGGFNVSYLKDIDWIRSMKFFYWGDLDAHGFQILNQFRTYFPNTTAVMMDDETLTHFPCGTGTVASNQNLQQLTDQELKLYNHLRQNNIRLEQEKITQVYAEERIRMLVR